MRNLKSKDFKSAMLLSLPPGEQVSIQCRNWAETQSKRTMCSNWFKAHEDEFKAAGVKSLTIQKVGDYVVLVTLNPVQTQEPFTDTLLEGDGKQIEEGDV